MHRYPLAVFLTTAYDALDGLMDLPVSRQRIGGLRDRRHCVPTPSKCAAVRKLIGYVYSVLRIDPFSLILHVRSRCVLLYSDTSGSTRFMVTHAYPPF